MPKLLQTGCEPFHTHPDNPSARAAALDGLDVGNMHVASALLPVEPHSAGGALEALLERHDPAAVLLTGLAAGRPQVTLECVALNVMGFNIPDNAGNSYRDAPAHPYADAPPACLSTLPLRDILAA